MHLSKIKKLIKLVSILYLQAVIIYSCHNSSSSSADLISKDSVVIAHGGQIFEQHCTSCHNIYQNSIGPKLAGITKEVSVDWLRHFIQNPEKIISSGDQRANDLFKEYKAMMPSFASFEDSDLDALIAFLNTHQANETETGKGKNKGIADPIPERIVYTGLQVGLEPVTQFPVTSDDGKKPLARITKLDYQPGSGDLFVVDLNGKLYKLVNGKPVLYVDMVAQKPKFIHKPGLATGFGSFAFHPDFAKNGIFYTTHTEPPRTKKAEFNYDDSIKSTVQWVLTEWQTKDTKANQFSGTNRELFRVDMVSGIHGVQEITFNPTSHPGDKDYGLLYIGVGDGGCVENGFPQLALSKEKIWGTVLRIDPRGRNSSNGQYGIPASNPFASGKNSKVPGEIYAYGFRNPHRITWTSRNQMLVCNIGQHHIESVNLIEPSHDYGWPIREGQFLIDFKGDINQVYPLPADDSTYKITYPVAEFDHDEGAAISGGLEYLGKTMPLLAGKYLFGDIPTGRLFLLNVADIRQRSLAPIQEWRVTINNELTTLTEACGSPRVDLHFGRDSSGELYILTKADGKLYKMVNATQTSL
ncbi:MAG: PQQ-dependent sugar dehydrogenase [Chitinophagaceae bacterium]|nr:PQQ-dependent sugar dehydrogenase [Chitinophagaceae bacterium]